MEAVVRSGDLNQVRALVRSGVQIDGEWGDSSLLIVAIQKGYKDIALELLAAGVVHAKDCDHQTALHWACYKEYGEVVQSLIDRGGRVNQQDVQGRTPIMMAGRALQYRTCDHVLLDFSNGEIFVSLLRAGARCEGLPQGQINEVLRYVYSKNDMFALRTLVLCGCSVSRESQCKLLLHAIHAADVFAVKALLKSGCSVNILSRMSQEELLCHASHKGNMFVVRALLENGCNVNILSAEDQEELLCHAANQSDMFVVHALLKNGCKVNILSNEDKEDILRCASHEGDIIVVPVLLKNGCSVSILPPEEQEEILHHAFYDRDIIIVHTLLKNGCSVNVLSSMDQKELLHLASHKGDTFVVRALLENGCSVNILPRENRQELLFHACHMHKGDLFVVRALLANDCHVSILSTDDQEVLLLHAVEEGDMFIVHALLKNGCNVNILSKEDQEELLCYANHEGNMLVVHLLLKNGCSVRVLSQVEQEVLLHHACRLGDILVVEALLSSGCNVNWMYDGDTPLMVATCEGHEEVVKKLILAGAKVGMRSTHGDTALHLAARQNQIQSGILLAEGGASVRIKNSVSKSPLELASKEFREAIQEVQSFATRKILCIIGNAEGGKSTLIAALKAERNTFLGKFVNHFRRVDDHLKRTAGIETLPHCSQRYGEVLFYDFAGQHEYHGPHQMFLEALLCKPGVSVTLLLVVKATKEEEAILHQLHHWLSPMALLANTFCPPQVIIVGSFLDKVTSTLEATAKLTRCIEATKEDLEDLPLDFAGFCLLNCRQPQSAGIDQLCRLLRDVPIPDFRATHTQYSLAWVLSQIRLYFTARAVQLQEFSTWLHDNKGNLPRTMPPAEEVCQDLSAAGHALYLSNKEDPTKSWLVLDLPSILHDVYGTLFSHSKGIVNEFGLLHFQHLKRLFPDLDLAIVQQLLITLEFCIPVDPAVLKVELSQLTQSEQASGWLFFPALISAKCPKLTLDSLPQQSVHFLCWQLRTAHKHSISARILQTILLHLAAHFVVKHHLMEGVQQHCCSIWWNGITWQSKKGVDVAVHINNNRVIQVVGVSIAPADESCQYLMDVINDILLTIRQLSPKLAATAFIVHPPKMTAYHEALPNPPPQELFPVVDIRNSIRDCEQYSLSLKDSNNYSMRIRVSNLFGGFTPSLEDIERVIWPVPERISPLSPSGPNQPQAPSEPNQPQAPTGPNQPQAPPGQNQPQAPTGPVPNQPQAPTGPNQPQAPTGPKQPQAPTGPKQPQAPTGLNQPQAPSEPNQPQAPTGPNQPQAPTGPELNQIQMLPEPNQTQSPIESGAQALLDISATPHPRDISELFSKQMAANWRDLALSLGVELYICENISKDHPTDCEEACWKMLNRWLKGERDTGKRERTWMTLLTAAHQVGHSQLVSSLRKEHFKPSSL